ncbi:hypothetical protein C8R47DRAFT_1224819 [Mycena vitilis]|nr:hypothetical protein C8R47DRAFT_1224819 [Mycena vitilis]
MSQIRTVRIPSDTDACTTSDTDVGTTSDPSDKVEAACDFCGASIAETTSRVFRCCQCDEDGAPALQCEQCCFELHLCRRDHAVDEWNDSLANWVTGNIDSTRLGARFSVKCGPATASWQRRVGVYHRARYTVGCATAVWFVTAVVAWSTCASPYTVCGHGTENAGARRRSGP